MFNLKYLVYLLLEKYCEYWLLSALTIPLNQLLPTVFIIFSKANFHISSSKPSTDLIHIPLNISRRVNFFQCLFTLFSAQQQMAATLKNLITAIKSYLKMKNKHPRFASSCANIAHTQTNIKTHKHSNSTPTNKLGFFFLSRIPRMRPSTDK